MAKKRGIKGKSIDVRVPEWEPLLDLAPAHVADFMWMFSVQLADGARVQAYKHYWTRRYVHMDGDGRTFVCAEPDRYEEVEPAWLLAEVLREHTADKDLFDVFNPHRPKPDEIRVEWTETATKNGISRERSAYVVQHCGLRYKHRAPWDTDAPRPGEFRTLFVGEDEAGAELEVAAVGSDEWEEGFVVFHAAESDRYRGLLLRARRWQQ